jgi:hypothetical protein
VSVTTAFSRLGRSALLLMGALACEGRISPGVPMGGAGGGDAAGGGAVASGGGGAQATGGGGGDDGGVPARLSNADVFNRLKVTCQGCHTLDARPYFKDLPSFENLLVYDVKWVRPNDPTGSALLGLLRGVGNQMPPLPSEPFAVLSDRALTQITTAELEEWIRNLPPRGGVTPVEPVRVRRKSAEQILASLYDQLSLTEADFMAPTAHAQLGTVLAPRASDSYAVRSNDAYGLADAYDQGGTLFGALGGPWHLEGKWRNDAVTPSFAQALVPVSQAFCRAAVTKSGNTAVLAKATLNDSTTTAPGLAAIRLNLASLHLRMLGEEATAAELDDLIDTVFEPYESKGAAVAWTAVCAALVRDPLWILY